MILPTFCVLEPPFNIFSSSSNCFFTKNRYLQWADAAEGDAAQHNAASAAAFSKGVGSTSLEDPLHQLLKGSQLAESLEGLSWAPRSLGGPTHRLCHLDPLWVVFVQT